MRRRYTTGSFEERINAVRGSISNVFLGIDVIVGFPGETEVEFEETYNFLKKIKPAYLHVFPYSERPGTPAIDFEGKVSSKESARRVHELTELCSELHAEFISKYVDTEMVALMESGRKEGMMFGYTENYIKVRIPFNKDLINRLVRVKLVEALDNGEMLASFICIAH